MLYVEFLITLVDLRFLIIWYWSLDTNYSLLSHIEFFYQLFSYKYVIKNQKWPVCHSKGKEFQSSKKVNTVKFQPLRYNFETLFMKCNETM